MAVLNAHQSILCPQLAVPPGQTSGEPKHYFWLPGINFCPFLIWEKNPKRVNITVYDRSKFAYLSLGSSKPWKKGKGHKGEQTGWPWEHKASREQHFTGDFSGHSFVRCGWTAFPPTTIFCAALPAGRQSSFGKTHFFRYKFMGVQIKEMFQLTAGTLNFRCHLFSSHHYKWHNGNCTDIVTEDVFYLKQNSEQ